MAAMYDRAALILDTESHPLGELSLELITLGLRPLYATELDELVLLSREYRSQVGAVLIPTGSLNEQLPGLRKHVLEPLGLSASALVPVGSRVAPELVDPLREEGVRFCLPAQYEPHELRYVVASALSVNDPGDLRLDSRVPCDLPVSIESEHRTVEGALVDLSLGGAFVGLAHPFPQDSVVLLRYALRGHTAAMRARVRWRVDAKSPAWRDQGMGVEFDDLDEASRAVIQDFVAEQVRRFRL
jgi:uncharacterized protein (TIGR02266 family)